MLRCGGPRIKGDKSGSDDLIRHRNSESQAVSPLWDPRRPRYNATLVAGRARATLLRVPPLTLITISITIIIIVAVVVTIITFCQRKTIGVELRWKRKQCFTKKIVSWAN